jgi:hypothetical protein
MARNWTEHELLIAMNVYCKLPFGKLNHRNSLIIQVAEQMERTPSSVSMKLCNLASFDPALQARGIKGLKAASQADRKMWDSFTANWEGMSEKSEAAFEELMQGATAPETPPASPPKGPSEVERMVKTRRLQTFFRNTVLASYENRCAVTGMAVEKMLIASHIIPWKDDVARRADPTNGICLNALYDQAFDRGFITFDDDFKLVISSLLKGEEIPEFQQINFVKMEGSPLLLPHRFRPDTVALEIHRSEIFQS